MSDQALRFRTCRDPAAKLTNDQKRLRRVTTPHQWWNRSKVTRTVPSEPGFRRLQSHDGGTCKPLRDVTT